MENTVKGILPPTLKMTLKTYCSLLARQALVHPKRSEISSCTQSPMPYTQPESLGDGQTKSASFGAQADGLEKEQLEISLTMPPDDVTGKHRDGEQNSVERANVSEDEGKVVADGTSHADQGENNFFKPRLGWTSKRHEPPVVGLLIDRQQRGATARSTDREETTLFKKPSRGTRKQQQQHRSPFARLRDYRSAGNSEERRQPSKPSSLTLADDGQPITFCHVAILYAVCSVVFFFCFLLCKFTLVYHVRYKKLQEFSAGDGSDRDTRTRWMRTSFRAGYAWSHI